MKHRIRSDRGITTIETLIYVAGSLAILAMMFTIMRGVNRGFLQGVQTVRMQKDSREAVNLMSREIRNTGLKHAFYESAPGKFVDTVVSQVMIGAGDSSSFSFKEGSRYDALTFRQARFDAAGKPLGVDTVTYDVDAARAMLRRKLNTGGFEDFCPNVDGMQFQYGVYAVGSSTLNDRPPTAATWGGTGSAVLVFDGSGMNVNLPASGTGGAIQSVLSLTLQSPKTYFCEVIASGNASFFANLKSLDMVLLDGAGKIIVSEPFRPGFSPIRRRLEFSAPNAAGCHLGFRMVTGGPAVLRIASVRFGELDLGAYTWKNAPTAAQKTAVRAIRILLMAKTSNPVSGQTGKDYTLANAVIPVKDRFMRRYYEEIVTIPNNGSF